VHHPEATVVVGVTRSGLGDIGLGATEIVDDVPGVCGSTSARKVGRCDDGAIKLTVNIKRQTGDADGL
jgi:hypothetical protein